MSILKKLAIVTALYFWSVTAQAVPMTSDVGNVTILGNDYFVSILYDSLGDFDGQSFDALLPSITFTTADEGSAAGNALNAAFPDQDWNPANSFSGTRIAISSTADDYTYLTILNNPTPIGPFGPFDPPSPRDHGNDFSFAQFSIVSAPIPEPSIIALFAVGLLGLGFAGRKARS